MNAVTDALVTCQSRTSQTGFADTQETAPERMRPAMVWAIDGKTGRPVARWVVCVQ